MFGKNKKAENDFTKEKLPSKRWQSFWDIINNHFGKLIELGFIILFSLLPILANIVITNVNVVNLENQYTAGILSEQEAINQIFSLYNISNLINIILLLILGVSIAGSVRIYRKLVWQEGLLFWQDFKIGIKQNYKSVLLTFFYIGILNFILQYLIRLYQLSPDLSGINFALAITIVISLYSVPLSIMIFVQTSIYSLPFLHKVKNGFLLIMRNAPLIFLGSIVLLSPWLILFINGDLVFIISFIILFLLILPIELLIGFLYFISILDKYINKENYPTIYEKGIWKNNA